MNEGAIGRGLPPELIVHTLAVRAEDGGGVRVRCTVRVGTMAPGRTLRYRDPAGGEHEVRVAAVDRHPRHLDLVLEGDVEALAPGRFLVGA